MENENNENQSTQTSENTTPSTTTSEKETNTDQTQTNQSQDTQTEGQSSDTGISGAVDGSSEPKDEPEAEVEENSGEADKGDASSEEGSSAQEDLEYELELSEDSPLSQEELDAIAEYATEKGLNKEQADQIIKNREALVSQGMTLAEQKLQQRYQELHDNFNKDPEFSGEKREENFAAIQKAVQKFGDEQMMEALKDPIIGNNVALGKFLANIGKMISDENFEGMKPGDGVDTSDNGSRESRMKRMYPEHFQQK